jgi:MSHA biogenesis protein MshN
MSVINQVLKDLDRQGANASAPAGVIAVNQAAAAAPRWPWWLSGVVGLAAAVWWFWPTPPVSHSPAVPVPALPPAPPQLRLSQDLDLAGHVGRKSVAPSAVWPTPNASPASPADNAFGSSALPSARHATPQPAPPTFVTALPAMKPRLDTRLSEPRPANAASAQVVKEIKPQTPQVQAEDLFRQASRLLEQGRNHDAQDKLESALRLDPNHAGVRQNLIALVLEASDGARAEALLREGLALQPNDPWYPRSLAQLQLQRGDSAQAAAILKNALVRRPDAANWALYAGTLVKLGKRGEAVQAYREALRLDATQGNWWIGLAVALEQSDEKAEAAAAYQRALQTRLSGELREFAQQKVRELGAR